MKTDKPTILIVDDERNTRNGLELLLRSDYDVTMAEDGEKGINLLKRHNYDIVLTDLRMPVYDGQQVLQATLEKTPAPPCIVFTAFGSVENAVEAMKAGAFDFVRKPVNYDRLEILLQRALESKRLRQENQELRQRLDQRFGMESIIGRSSAMQSVIDTVKQVAPTRSTVLITGESGTGKELIAQSLHQLSERPGRFIPVHCAALPATLLESELFGHEKGAFTGASEQRIGRFELADKGTLFLDEIGEIDAQVQVKLLRALESRTFERLGGIEPVTTDTRLLTATNRDLRAMVDAGEFREDLFYRLDVVTIKLPPLRERLEDIPLLAKHFLDQFATENVKKIEGISDQAMNALCAYDWPGNIRELRNCIERMVVLSRERVLQVDNVPTNVRQKSTPGIPDAAPVEAASLSIDRNEKNLIIRALNECDGNRTKAAEKLGISRRTLHRKLHTYDLI